MIGLSVLFWPSWPRHQSKCGLKQRRGARHQLIVLKRRLHGRVRSRSMNRWSLSSSVSLVPSILEVLTIIRRDALSWIGPVLLLLALEVAPTGRATQIERSCSLDRRIASKIAHAECFS